PGRQTVFRRGTTELATPARDATVILTPRARLIVTVPLEGRSDYADTIDAHLRRIGSTQDIKEQTYIAANDVTPVFAAGSSPTTLEDSVQVVSNSFGTFQLTEIPAGIYEITVKAPGFVTGRSDTLTLFNGSGQSVTPTFGSDALGNLSPATSLGSLRGGDATNDNQVDLSDANLIFCCGVGGPNVWNSVPGDANYVRDADINYDGVINSIDLGFVTKNFGNVGFGAPPVFRTINEGGDNSAAIAKVTGVEDVEAWWPGRVFEVTIQVQGMSDVAAYDLRVSYDPEKVKPLAADQAVSQGNVFDENPAGSLFFHRVQPGAIDVASGRIGADWSASGDAELASIRFVALGDDPGVIDIVTGQVVNSAHVGIPVRVEKARALPMVAALHQNYPNPFNPSTEIRFDIPTARDVKLRIYNQLGQTVRTLVDHRMKAGTYTFEWDGSNQAGQGVASGVYFYNLQAGDFRDLRKMTLVK
ncbi:MAG: FlgD immunoglobulin-like domain containing protein, partial [Candidatus Latescibacterota bacterium]